MSNSIEEFLEGIPKDKTITTIEQNGTLMLTQEEVNKIPTNIVINGFNIKDTIVEVLKTYLNNCLLEDRINMYKLASDIQTALAIKFGLK
jgi:hypothetical protein